ncbi:MAG TPA: hypothetical protein VKG26_09500 [Bacteroidia bacterium]|nr:hypothetical protein [Bacteroidia bacterium]
MTELKKLDRSEFQLAIIATFHNLATYLNMEAFIEVYIKLESIKCNLANCLLVSMEGRKEHYYTISNNVKKELEDFFNFHDEIVEHTFKENNKKNAH